MFDDWEQWEATKALKGMNWWQMTSPIIFLKNLLRSVTVRWSDYLKLTRATLGLNLNVTFDNFDWFDHVMQNMVMNHESWFSVWQPGVETLGQRWPKVFTPGLAIKQSDSKKFSDSLCSFWDSWFLSKNSFGISVSLPRGHQPGVRYESCEVMITL